MNKPILCFFDVDHTITRHSTGRHFAFHAVRKGYIPVMALFSIPVFYIKYRLGQVNDSDLDGEYSFFKGIPEHELTDLGREIFDERIRNDIYPEARECIRLLQESGVEVVLATSSVDLVINPLASFLGIETVLAASLEYTEGLCTGRLREGLFFSKMKKEKALDFLKSRNIQPSECSFYTDSIHDLPLLTAVGKPVAVNPDIRLKKYAKSHQWDILSFR